MSNPVGAQRYGLGGGDAYYDAVKYGGYTGTREQFGRDQAEFAENATAVAEAKEEVERNTQTVVNTAQTFTEETVPAAIQSVEEKGDTEEDRLEARTTELVQSINTAGAVQVQAVEDEGTEQIGLVSGAGTAQVEAVEQAGSDQVDAVEAAGSTQVGNVNNAGTTQVGNVNNAGSTQISAVNSEGSTQVQAVQDKGTEVLNSIPSDYTELTEDVDNLKTAINYISYTPSENMSINIHNSIVLPTNIRHETGFCCICVPCEAGDVFHVTGHGGNTTRLWGFSNSSGELISESAAALTATNLKLVAPENAGYFAYNSFMADPHSVSKGYSPAVEIPKLIDKDYDFAGYIEHNNLLNYNPNGNLYNAYSIIREKYINPSTGNISNVSGNTEWAYCPNYIAVTPGANICSTDQMIIAYYDKEFNIISSMQMDATKQTVIPNNAVYARFSVSSRDHFSVVVMYGTTIDASIGTYSFRLEGLNNEVVPIVVAPSGGDYSSFTEAVYLNIDNKRPIIVKPGTYDIVSEYVSLFGQTVVDNLSDSTSGINNFQFGVRLHDREVVFESGAHIICDWSGHTVDSTHRFCALRIEPNTKLVGLDLDCTNTFYCVHDDYGTLDESPFTNEYINCRIIGHSLYNANCIGGGCHKYSRHILENCYFKNNVLSDNIVLSADVRYHNTNTENAEPEVYISNCYFSNNFNANYYGTQTTKMKVYVNNCYVPKGINKLAESSASTVDNVELYAWNNQTS